MRSRISRFGQMLSLQLAKAGAATLSKIKASTATLPQQEESDSADVQRAELIYPAFSVQR